MHISDWICAGHTRPLEYEERITLWRVHESISLTGDVQVTKDRKNTKSYHCLDRYEVVSLTGYAEGLNRPRARDDLSLTG